MAAKLSISVLGIGLLGCSVAVLAECELKSRSNDVILMQCSASPSDDDFTKVGQDACGDDSACNVWFWGAGVDLPENAPEKDSDLPKSLSSQALAVWVNDSGSLLKLKKVK